MVVQENLRRNVEVLRQINLDIGTSTNEHLPTMLLCRYPDHADGGLTDADMTRRKFPSARDYAHLI